MTDTQRPGRAARIRRRVARVVAGLAVLTIVIIGFQLGFVDINDHPGLVTTVLVAVAVFIVAFPFVGFRAAERDSPDPIENGQQD